ncbi:hypothetical protein C8Q77DRAFT_656198 [Trametes polyzona]|nr:hypothetical protein C8Q77DRAFT_656198 [Trametes polyzona]
MVAAFVPAQAGTGECGSEAHRLGPSAGIEIRQKGFETTPWRVGRRTRSCRLGLSDDVDPRATTPSLSPLPYSISNLSTSLSLRPCSGRACTERCCHETPTAHEFRLSVHADPALVQRALREQCPRAALRPAGSSTNTGDPACTRVRRASRTPARNVLIASPSRALGYWISASPRELHNLPCLSFFPSRLASSRPYSVWTHLTRRVMRPRPDFQTAAAWS